MNSMMAFCYLDRNAKGLCPFRVAILVDIVYNMLKTPIKVYNIQSLLFENISAYFALYIFA